MKPTRDELRLAASALRWAQFGYRKPEEQHAIGRVRLWLIEQAGPLPSHRHVLAEELVIYASRDKNLHHTQMSMARGRLKPVHWRLWVRQHVLYFYVHDVALVWAMPVEICRAARTLARYYAVRVHEEENK